MNIEFEKDGIKKFADERFTDDLKAVGWKVVEDKPVVKKAVKKSAKKETK